MQARLPDFERTAGPGSESTLPRVISMAEFVSRDTRSRRRHPEELRPWEPGRARDRAYSVVSTLQQGVEHGRSSTGTAVQGLSKDSRERGPAISFHEGAVHEPDTQASTTRDRAARIGCASGGDAGHGFGRRPRATHHQIASRRRTAGAGHARVSSRQEARSTSGRQDDQGKVQQEKGGYPGNGNQRPVRAGHSQTREGAIQGFGSTFGPASSEETRHACKAGRASGQAKDI